MLLLVACESPDANVVGLLEERAAADEIGTALLADGGDALLEAFGPGLNSLPLSEVAEGLDPGRFWSEHAHAMQEWRVEKWSKGADTSADDEMIAAVAADPDAYLTEADGSFPATALTADGTILSISISSDASDDGDAGAPRYPVYFVGASAADDADEQAATSPAPPPATTYYLCMCGMNISKKMDTSNDEFELRVRQRKSTATMPAFSQYSGVDSTSNTGQFQFHTVSSFTDNAGKTITPTVVSKQGSTLCAGKDTGGNATGVALAPFDSSTCSTAILPTEDDWNAGQYNPNSSTVYGVGSTTLKGSATLTTNCSGSTTASAYDNPTVTGKAGPATSSTSSVNFNLAYTTPTTVASYEDDFYNSVFYSLSPATSDLSSSATSTSSIKAYTAGYVTLYLMKATSSNCASVCKSWYSAGYCSF